MKFTMRVQLCGCSTKIINLDEETFYVEEDGERLHFNSSYEERFNTLISLFTIKNEWVNEVNVGGEYELMFENNGKMECFSFSSELPDNWFLFNSYLYNLVGDDYE